MLAIACLLVTLVACPVFSAPLPGEQLIFEDDFNSFDFTKWKHEITMSGGGNWEFQLYWNNRSNSYVRDSSLYISPTFTSDMIGEANLRNGFRMDLWGSTDADRCTGNAFYGCERTSGAGGNILNPIQSARISTSQSMNIRHGRVEVRAKLPKGDWLWPAIWMLPQYNEYGNWPASGEIDIMESRGNLDYPREIGGGVDSYGSTLHWGPEFGTNRYEMTHNVYTVPQGTLADDYHVYGLYWDDEVLFTYIDNVGNKVLQVDFRQDSMWDRGRFPSTYNNPWLQGTNAAPFDRPFYLIINLAVGGTAGYFNDNAPGKPWRDYSPNAVNEFWNARSAWGPTWNGEDAAFKIDWVRVYRLAH